MNLFGKGTYLLVFNLPETEMIFRNKVTTLTRGIYFYAGSAFGSGGLKSRLSRHTKDNKKIHWHIDLITDRFRPLLILVNEGERSFEHDYVKVLSAYKEASFPLSNFGNGDCSVCHSHLVRFESLPAVLGEKLTDRFRGMRFLSLNDDGVYSELFLPSFLNKFNSISSGYKSYRKEK